LCYKATLDPTKSKIFTFNTGIRVAEGDIIITFQWLTGTDNNGGVTSPTDNLGSAYETVFGVPTYLGVPYNCSSSTQDITGLGNAYGAYSAGSGLLSVKFFWNNPPDTVPGYVVYVLHGQTAYGNIYYQMNTNYPVNTGQQATGNSVSITTSGLPSTTYHYALLVAYVSNDPCLNAMPSLTAQGFKQALLWGDSCFKICSSQPDTLSDALYYAYVYSESDFTFDLQFTYANTTIYGYGLVLV